MQKMLVSNESFKLASPFFSLKAFLYMVCWDAKTTIITSIFRTCLNFKTISQSGQILFYKRLLIYHKQVFTLPNSYFSTLWHIIDVSLISGPFQPINRSFKKTFKTWPLRNRISDYNPEIKRKLHVGARSPSSVCRQKKHDCLIFAHLTSSLSNKPQHETKKHSSPYWSTTTRKTWGMSRCRSTCFIFDKLFVIGMDTGSDFPFFSSIQEHHQFRGKKTFLENASGKTGCL